MGREINLNSILALDAEIIRLERTRNPPLNIARIPPEILGHIFRFNVNATGVGDPDFPEIPKGSYNILLVCHHWFQVANLTPGLWNSWGNNLRDWKRWHLRSGTSALDLFLDGWRYHDGVFDEALRDTLRDRTARDVIRKVHLKSNNTRLLTAIISSLIPEGEDVRPSSIESIVLRNVDVSDLFARYRFPKLRNLHLSSNFKISSWDYLKSTTTALTSLSLRYVDTVPPSAIPTASQIFSLLASNPNLRSLTLGPALINGNDGCDPKLRVSLRHLEYIDLSGPFRDVFPILYRLELPERMDGRGIRLCDCTPQEVLEVIGPYIRDCLRGDARFGDRLGIFVSFAPLFNHITLHVGVVGVGYRDLDRRPQYGLPYGCFELELSRLIPRDVTKNLHLDIHALLPQESIVDFETDLPVTEEIILTMPNLEVLYLIRPVVSHRFLLPDPRGPNAHNKLLPSLRRLYLKDARAVDDNWYPLITYLIHQTCGNQAVSLELFGDGVHVCPEVIERIEGLVEELVYEPDPDSGCPFDKCPWAE